jgi:hypothetical protein
VGIIATDPQGTDISPIRKQSWTITITTANGLTATGYLPPWAAEDPSKGGVPASAFSRVLADINHHRAFDGLDPAGVGRLITALRAQADRLESEVLPQLVSARTDWSAHQWAR